jgi:hypothetical protein
VVLNSDLSIWQRGTTFSGGNAFAADRWRPDATTTAARGTGPGFIRYCLDITGSSTNPAVRQSIELPAAGSAGPFQIGTTWTFSVYAKTSTTVALPLTFYAAFLDSIAAGLGNAVTVVGGVNMGVPTTSWARYSTTFTIASSPAGTNTALSIVPYLSSGAYAGTFSITGAQLELGATATPFQTATGNYATELASCQRHYWKTSGTSTYARHSGFSPAVSASQILLALQNPVQMRSAPYAVEFLSLSTYDNTNIGAAVSSITINGDSNPYISYLAVGTTGLTQFRPYQLMNNGTASGYLGLSADL